MVRSAQQAVAHKIHVLPGLIGQAREFPCTYLFVVSGMNITLITVKIRQVFQKLRNEEFGVARKAS